MPKSAAITSLCSCLVGIPVLGPPRWQSTITTGISAAWARPMASCINDSPGPAVAVMARAPAAPAPIAVVMAEISSSHWSTTPPKRGKWRCSHSMISEAGVIG